MIAENKNLRLFFWSNVRAVTNDSPKFNYNGFLVASYELRLYPVLIVTWPATGEFSVTALTGTFLSQNFTEKPLQVGLVADMEIVELVTVNPSDSLTGK